MEPPTATFICEVRDPVAGVVKEYKLSFFASDNSVSMYDPLAKHFFLRRMIPPERLALASFTLGNVVVVNARPVKIIDYGDALTRSRYENSRGSMLIIVKPDAYHHTGKILTMVANAGLDLGRLRMVKFSLDEARAFLSLSDSSSSEGSAATGPAAIAAMSENRADDAGYLASDHCLAFEVSGDDVMAMTHQLCGPADPAIAREAAPESIRAIFGRDRRANAVYCSRAVDSAMPELDFIFERKYKSSAVCTHCSLCIIKPHAVSAKATGLIIDRILKQGLEISAAKAMTLTRTDAGDYLEAYKGVVSEFQEWIADMASGPSVLLEVRGEDAVEKMRALAGPYDPAIARELRPTTLRAVFGIDSVRSGVHVTDLVTDGPLECKFMFHVLNQ